MIPELTRALVFYVITVMVSTNTRVQLHRFAIWTVGAHAAGYLVSFLLYNTMDYLAADAIGYTITIALLFIILLYEAEIDSLKQRTLIIVIYFAISIIVDLVYVYLMNYEI